MGIASLNDIPYEIMINFILPHITIKEVGALSMVSPTWRDMCNEQDVWKDLYLRTIRANILETSVHKDPRGWQYDHLKTGELCSSKTYCRNSVNYLNGAWGVRRCISDDLHKELKSWREIRTDGIDSDEFVSPPITPGGNISSWFNPRDSTQYASYIMDEWTKYNANKGLSTINLCQCPDHYEFDTLGVPGGCRNYKSFKKLVLKKLSTQSKHMAKKRTAIMRRKYSEYEKSRVRMMRADREFRRVKIESQKSNILCEKLSIANKELK